MKKSNQDTDNHIKNSSTSGSSKEKASFDQNGKGASPKYGKAGDSANEAGNENVIDTPRKKDSK